MPVQYEISPELNLLIYICTDSLTGEKFFEVSDKVPLDSKYKPKMKIVIDIFSAEIDTSLSDLYLAIEKNKEMKRSGHELGQAAVFTKSSSLKFLGDALKLMSPEAPSNFGIFNNKQDVVRWLGLSDVEDQAIQFWEKAKSKS